MFCCLSSIIGEVHLIYIIILFILLLFYSMGKAKTRKAVAKRFKVTKTGKLLHSKTCRRHLLVKKGRTTKKDKFGQEIDKVEWRRMSRMISPLMRG